MDKEAKIIIDGKELICPIIEGTEAERAIDVQALRKDTGLITYDDGYGNTGSCKSAITYIDGEKGVLCHRGYSIENLAEGTLFMEAAYMLIYGDLPNSQEFERFRGRVASNANIHQGLMRNFEGYPSNAHPMAVMSSMLNGLGCYYPEMTSNDRQQDLENFDWSVALLLAKVRTIAAMTYRAKGGRAAVYSKPNYHYTENFLHMMFSEPNADYYPRTEIINALNLIFLLHADHEQNCSTSTVRMVASSGANLFASVSAGVCALWGPLHGGANMRVIQMLQDIHDQGDDGTRFIEDAKNGKQRLMGFGHRVYKNFDPRARILGEAAEKLFVKIGKQDPLLNIARKLEEIALNDEYFIQRKLYPNVDFYSGIILRAIGVPVDFFTVIFAIGRLPGWIAHWYEIASEEKQKIHRPRQIYIGEARRKVIPIDDRK